MSILNDLISEMAAGGVTSAHAIAGFRGGIGGKTSKKQRKKEDMIRRRLQPVGNFFNMTVVSEAEQKFDPADVMSKMAAADEKAKHMEDTKTFGLEDEHGSIVKVSVPKEEADDFETALSHLLAGEDTDWDETEQVTGIEIAEVLFKLKDRFTIVDVVWPEIEEDQEEDATDANEETLGDETGDEGDDELDDEFGDEEGDEDDMTADEDTDDEYDQMSALSQVIDLLKSQQDAQKAEAEAKKAEAEAEQAQAERDAAIAKVRQEEQILDMETYYKKQKEGDKEAKKLAQLAKWKHDMAADGDEDLAAEQEEDSTDSVVNAKDVGKIYDKVDKDGDGEMKPQEFLRYLFKYLGDR